MMFAGSRSPWGLVVVLLALLPSLVAQERARPELIQRLVAIWQRDLARFTATTWKFHAEIGVEPFAQTCQLMRYGHVLDANRHWRSPRRGSSDRHCLPR